MTASILRLIESDNASAREQGYRLVAKQFRRAPIPDDVRAALTRRVDEGAAREDALIAAISAGTAPLEMSVFLEVLEHGTVNQQRAMVAQLWYRHPAGDARRLVALLADIAAGSGTLAFDAANVLASRGHASATARLVELVAASRTTSASLEHYARETLSPALQRSVEDELTRHL